jgi:hypothetical protein
MRSTDEDPSTADQHEAANSPSRAFVPPPAERAETALVPDYDGLYARAMNDPIATCTSRGVTSRH